MFSFKIYYKEAVFLVLMYTFKSLYRLYFSFYRRVYNYLDLIVIDVFYIQIRRPQILIIMNLDYLLLSYIYLTLIYLIFIRL